MFPDKESRNKRKYQCFVCGVEHETYDAYKAHILDEHEEGREYLKCPSCEAPVRDMKLHFEVKHPNRLMPRGIQTKVAVWHDFKGGKKKTKKTNFKKGEFESKKMGMNIPYRSGYESEFYHLLEEDTDVAAYFAEPFRVPYYFNGKWHEYVPDLRINFHDGTVQIAEIKPATQTGLEQNKAKWAAMKEYADKLGWQFTVITEVGINKMKSKIKHQKEDS